jgi:hypothetical protein
MLREGSKQCLLHPHFEGPFFAGGPGQTPKSLWTVPSSSHTENSIVVRFKPSPQDDPRNSEISTVPLFSHFAAARRQPPPRNARVARDGEAGGATAGSTRGS